MLRQHKVHAFDQQAVHGPAGMERHGPQAVVPLGVQAQMHAASSIAASIVSPFGLVGGKPRALMDSLRSPQFDGDCSGSGHGFI